MKTKLLLLSAVSTFILQHSSFGQGAITPPGTPAPTMKTLAQLDAKLDPRTPISSAPFTITQPGSYYLTTNLTGSFFLTHGITIASGNVTLDLNGFALTSTPGSSFNGIYVSGIYTNITVRNGTISGWGGVGVEGNSLNGRDETFEHLMVSANGGGGISAGRSSVVQDCVCGANGANGIASNGGLVRHCTARDGSTGIYLAAATAADCLVQNNTQSGIVLDLPGSEALRNNCNGNNTGLLGNAAGIYINDSNNRIEENHVSASGVAGIKVAAGYINNVVIRNSVVGTNNYVGTAGNDFGPIGTAATATSPWANLSH